MQNSNFPPQNVFLFQIRTLRRLKYTDPEGGGIADFGTLDNFRFYRYARVTWVVHVCGYLRFLKAEAKINTRISQVL